MIHEDVLRTPLLLGRSSALWAYANWALCLIALSMRADSPLVSWRTPRPQRGDL